MEDPSPLQSPAARSSTRTARHALPLISLPPLGGNFVCQNTASCSAVSVSIGGNMTVNGNGGATVTGNSVGGNVQVNNNGNGGATVEGNEINGSLTCLGNATLARSGNTVRGTTIATTRARAKSRYNPRRRSNFRFGCLHSDKHRLGQHGAQWGSKGGSPRRLRRSDAAERLAEQRRGGEVELVALWLHRANCGKP